MKRIEWHRSSPMHGVRVQTLFLFVSNNFLRGQSWRISLPPFIWVGKVKCHFQKKPRQGFPDFQRSIRRLKKERHLYTCEGLHGYTKCLHSVCHFVHGKYVVCTANFSTFLALYHLAISFFHTFFFPGSLGNWSIIFLNVHIKNLNLFFSRMSSYLLRYLQLLRITLCMWSKISSFDLRFLIRFTGRVTYQSVHFISSYWAWKKATSNKSI